MAIVSKKTGSSSTPKQQKIIVNPYDCPENVLDLMSQISSARPTANSDFFYNQLSCLWKDDNSLMNFFEENRSRLLNIDFFSDLCNKIDNLCVELQTRENTNHTQVVVAGGYSAGKSSFLNKLIGDGNLLPTGTDPVSVVSTYIYFSNQKKEYNRDEVKVKGVNAKNAVVDLPVDILQAIQHSSKSNVHIASVLDKLFVEVSSKNLNDIVLIDTPGYNNSTKKNESNGKTDEETAIESLKDGQILIWLMQKGSFDASDAQIVDSFDGPKLFVFNKADKYKAEVENIIKEQGADLKKKYGDTLIDVIAYSSTDDKLYGSLKGYKSLYEIMEKIKSYGQGNSGRQRLISEITKMFDDELEASNFQIESYKENLAESQERKKNAVKGRNEDKQVINNNKDLLENVADAYHLLDQKCSSFIELSRTLLTNYDSFFDRVLYFEKNEHEFMFSSSLTEPLQSAGSTLSRMFDLFNNEIDSYNNILSELYDAEKLKSGMAEIFNPVFDFVSEKIEMPVHSAEIDCDRIKIELKDEEDFSHNLNLFKKQCLDVINKGVSKYDAQNISEKVHSVPEDKEKNDVFVAIEKNDMKSFVVALSKNNDLSKCNSSKLNILNYCIYFGNTEMVRFLLEHDANPSIKDDRGYNAFHTAVECNNQPICKLLLSYDPDLIDTKTESGEDVGSLASKNTFSVWLNTII